METLPHEAVWDDNILLATELLINGADANARGEGGYVPLHGAQSGKMVKLLINFGALPSVGDDIGCTPLHDSGIEDVVKALIECGANVNAQNQFGQTPLHGFVNIEKQGIIKLLLDAGADLNIKNREGKTPLNKCAIHENVKLLIEHINNDKKQK